MILMNKFYIINILLIYIINNMAKKCPPGVICIENVTFLFFFMLIFAILVFMYIKYYNNSINSTNYIDNKLNNNICNKCNNNKFNNICKTCDTNTNSLTNLSVKPSFGYNNNDDILLNPYTPPLRDDRIFNNDYCGDKIPINIATQSFNTNYRQIGILTRVNGGELILPLMGRPLFRNRDKWNFYTMNDKNSMIKLPISFKNRSCTSQQGCDNVYNGDTVYVEGLNDIFRVTIYDNNSMEYIPYL